MHPNSVDRSRRRSLYARYTEDQRTRYAGRTNLINALTGKIPFRKHYLSSLLNLQENPETQQLNKTLKPDSLQQTSFKTII